MAFYLDDPKIQRRSRNLALAWIPPWERTEFGDYPGHPFRGNQHTDAAGGRQATSDYHDSDEPGPYGNGKVLQAKHDGKVVGELEHKISGRTLTLYNIKVDSSVRRQGEASKMLDHLVERHNVARVQVATTFTDDGHGWMLDWERKHPDLIAPKDDWAKLHDRMYERRMAEKTSASLTVFAYETFGDYPGHPFRGNQWTDAAGNSVAEKSNDPPEGARPEFKEGDDYDKYRPRDQAWKAQMERALSMGTITEKDAEKRGFYSTYSTDGWKPLPDTLYHVTTAKDAVERDGLKTRDELDMGRGAGLGGGESDTISFTTDPDIAAAVEYGLREMHQAANGEITPAELIARAERPDADEAPKPFVTDMMQYHDRNWQPGQPYPEGVRNLLSGEKRLSYAEGGSITKPTTETEAAEKGWRPADSAIPIVGGDGIERYMNWVRPMTPDEKTEAEVDWYKHYSYWRDAAGGRTDPLFFTSDTKALAAMNPDQFATLKFTPAPGAQGYQTSGMAEWRTKTGDAVQLDGVAAALEFG